MTKEEILQVFNIKNKITKKEQQLEYELPEKHLEIEYKNSIRKIDDFIIVHTDGEMYAGVIFLTGGICVQFGTRGENNSNECWITIGYDDIIKIVIDDVTWQSPGK